MYQNDLNMHWISCTIQFSYPQRLFRSCKRHQAVINYRTEYIIVKWSGSSESHLCSGDNCSVFEHFTASIGDLMVANWVYWRRDNWLHMMSYENDIVYYLIFKWWLSYLNGFWIYVIVRQLCCADSRPHGPLDQMLISHFKKNKFEIGIFIYYN